MRWRLPALIALATIVAGCSGATASDQLTVTLDEWEIGVSHSNYVTGQVEVSVANEGEFPHTLVVEGPAGEVIAATDVVQPGEAVMLDLDLIADEYRFTCRIVATADDGTVVDHFAEGMVATAGADRDT